jgi:hypothetical protein
MDVVPPCIGILLSSQRRPTIGVYIHQTGYVTQGMYICIGLPVDPWATPSVNYTSFSIMAQFKA